MTELSRAQKEAVERFGGDVCVSAGAGSGKTSVLVDRFALAVTGHGARPDEILAITFTDKAANEMKERLVAKFGKLGLEKERRALEDAYIGTIHSFCARLLRENPVEAGVDPYFKVLSEGEAELLMTQALDRVFEAQASEKEWLAFLVERGEARVRDAILSLYAHFRAAGEDESLLAPRDGFSRKRIEARLSATLLKAAAAVGKPSNATEEKIAAAAREFQAALAAPFGPESFSRARAALGALEARGKHADAVKSVQADAAEWLPAALQELYAPKKAEFLRVFGEFRAAIEAEKRVRAAFDFDDLPILALRLLSGASPEKKAVRARYRERFRHVFVDEFQDTSPLQAKLIDHLIRGNLFFVGDRQQSIYAFRHAEPALFAEYEKRAGARIPLVENYRSRRAVLEFANAFFSSAFPAESFLALKAARRFRLEGEGTVEILGSVYGKSEPRKSLEEARALEASLLAARIRELVDSGARVEDGTPEGRKMGWGDVAILMRSTKLSPVYERELARRGIPFYSTKSRGFFERPEVKDLVHFLALLDHPEDDTALAAVLRSPLGGVSDDGLYWMAAHAKAARKETPLARALDALERVPNLSEPDRARALALADFLEDLRARKNRVAVSAALEETLRWSGYECVVLSRPGGAQAVANVRKLVETARSLEEKTPLDASAFVRHVRGFAEREDAAEARIAAQGGDAVLIASVHAAKGLEFPVVALANMGGRPKPRRFPCAIASREAGLGLSLPDPDDSDESLADAAWQAAAQTFSAREKEEADRVFYVAVTRAKERLLLCGSALSELSKDSSWMARVLAFFGWGTAAWKPELAGIPVGVLWAAPAISPVEYAANPASGAAGETAEAILSRLELPKRPYDLAVDLTVTDLLPPKAFDAASADPDTIDLEDPERTPRNEYGTLFHRLMEAGTLASPRGKTSAEFAADLLSPLTQPEREEALAASAAFWKGGFGAAIKKASAVHPELPFIYKTPYGLLKGQIDLVYKDADGWTILDYKTNRVSPDDVEAAAAGYELQLGLYGLVFRALTGEAPRRGVLWFSVPGQAREYVWKDEDFEALEKRFLEGFRAAAALRAGA